MEEAASSGAARTLAPAPPCGPGEPGITDAIDAALIRQTCTEVLWAVRPVPEAEREEVGGLLLGHMQLLIPELAAAVPLLKGAWRDTADHVLVSSRRMLAGGAGPQREDLHGLATQVRALLDLRQQAGPLSCLAALITEGRP
ncbi:DUF6415 family natural product biosynthesis protein [Streptomyces sp. NPDC001068]|uniref:DUF6415 family natural product biosynthesis protein n=1 Tax=Streptomyces sp. NPDC001068 TaxID=3364544 RepID=UPI00369F2286